MNVRAPMTLGLALTLAFGLPVGIGRAADSDAAPQVHDGSHDFDFARGVWHTHITRVLDPFDGGTHITTSDGTKTAMPIWGGRGWIEELDVDGQDGHWQGATIFLYNAESGQWSQSYIDSDTAEVDTPGIGEFKDGRGEFYATGKYRDRNVLVRGVWSDITTNSHRYEISYSRDGGRTWAAVFKAYLTRVSRSAG